MVIYTPSESSAKTVTVGVEEAVVHVVNPIDEYTGNPVAGGNVYIGISGYNPPFVHIGSAPMDIWFGEGHPYDLGVSYTIAVEVDGYIYAADQLALVVGDEITTEGALLSCTTQTPNYSNGCDLLKHYDSNNDGYHSMDDTLEAIQDWYEELITLTENIAIIKSWAGSGINYLCSGCYEAAHDTALTLDVTDAEGNPITEAYVGDTLHIVGELRDVEDNIVLCATLIRLYRNGAHTGLTDLTDGSGIYSIAYTIVEADKPSVSFKTVFAGT